MAGAVNGWLAGGEAVLKLPDAIAAIPSAVSRLASGTASAATQLWNDPVGSVTNAMASGVDGFRTGFNQTVNGNGFAMGGAVFAMGTMGVPLGRAESVVGTGLEREIIDFSRGEALAPGFYRADPSQLRFMQPTVSPNFSAGGTIDTLAADLRAGRITPDTVNGGPLRVVMVDGQPFSFDHRRLVSYNMAGVQDVPIRVMNLADDPVFAGQVRDRFNPIRGEGQQVVVVPSTGRPAVIRDLYNQGLVGRPR